jgi:hypothetical protein
MYRSRTVKEMERRWDSERRLLNDRIDQLINKIMHLSGKPVPEYDEYPEVPAEYDYDKLMFAEASLMEDDLAAG